MGRANMAAMSDELTYDQLIAELATRQYGLVHRFELLATGVPEHVIQRRLTSGGLLPIQPRVYAVAGAPRSPHQELLAACRSACPEAAVSHRSAARLWGLDGPFSGFVELVVPRLDKGRPHGAIVHRSTDLVPSHVTIRQGLPVTNPLRTLVDLGAVTPQPVLDRAVDDALAKRLVSFEGLLVMLESVARRGRRGVGKLRASLAERTDAPESVLEAEMERLLARSDLPDSERQYEVRVDGRFVARVDFAYSKVRVAIECDGSSTRASREALQYDDTRQNGLVGAGWILLRFTWHDVVGRPEYVISTIAAALARRRHELGLVA